MFCTSINVLGLYLSLKNTAHINHCHKSLKGFQKFSGNFCKHNYAHGQHQTIESNGYIIYSETKKWLKHRNRIHSCIRKIFKKHYYHEF